MILNLKFASEKNVNKNLKFIFNLKIFQNFIIKNITNKIQPTRV